MKDEDYSMEHLRKFKYIECVQKETTRFYGPGNGIFLRNCIQDHTIGSVPIHKGTIVDYQVVGLHRSEKYYKDPHEFNPDRWLNECKDQPT